MDRVWRKGEGVKGRISAIIWSASHLFGQNKATNQEEGL